MPKPINKNSPVAVVRARLGLKIQEFADFLDYGSPMLMQIESGRKPVPQALAQRILDQLGGVPADLLLKRRLTASDRERIKPIPLHIVRHFSPVPREPVELMIEFVAAYCALAKHSVNPRIGTLAIRRTIHDLLSRWGVSKEEFESANTAIRKALTEWREDVYGPTLGKIEQAVGDCSYFKEAVIKASSLKDETIEILRGSGSEQARISKKFDSQLIEDLAQHGTTIGQKRARSRHKRVKQEAIIAEKKKAIRKVSAAHQARHEAIMRRKREAKGNL